MKLDKVGEVVGSVAEETIGFYAFTAER